MLPLLNIKKIRQKEIHKITEFPNASRFSHSIITTTGPPYFMPLPPGLTVLPVLPVLLAGLPVLLTGLLGLPTGLPVLLRKLPGLPTWPVPSRLRNPGASQSIKHSSTFFLQIFKNRSKHFKPKNFNKRTKLKPLKK